MLEDKSLINPPLRMCHKIRLYPTTLQEEYLLQACGNRRHAYNFGIALFKWENAAKSKKTSMFDARKLYTSMIDEHFPFMRKSSKEVFQEAFSDVEITVKSFWKTVKSKKKCQLHFRSKFDSKQSFRINRKSAVQEVIKVEGHTLGIPRLKSRIEMAESVRFDGIIKTVTISHEAGQWHASFCIDRGEIQRAEHLHPNDAVGVDLGIKHFATLSDGNVIDAPMPLKRSLKKLARLQRSLSRKTKGSKNRTKAKLKISRLYLRIRSIRKDFLHKFTSWIVKKFGSICIEDLNVSGMIRNHCLARSISDLGWYEFRIMLEYKSLLYGAGLWMVDRFYPSSQTCSSCGSVLEGKQKLKLSERIYKCPQCNLEIDRDLNAALNLKALAV